jgi:ABC-2 type transport system ATP-binding protein
MPQILVEELSKTYRIAERDPGTLGALRGLFHRRWRSVEALDRVSFQLERGELVGLIGPNGAGKSTTIKILSGIMEPTSGRCEVDGLTPWRDRVKHVARIGVVFGQRSQLWWDLPVIEGFDLLRDIYRVSPETYAASRDELVSLLRLERLLDQPVRQLSLGQRMRGDFAAAMLHDPQVVFLDEPTIGLDVVAKEAIREFIAGINRERGTTFILTTHDLADVERLCRRIVLIDRGTLIFDGEVDTLRDQYGTHRTLVVELCDPVDHVEMEGTEAELVTKTLARFRFDRRTISAEALIRRIADTYSVSDISIEEPELESIIRRIYREGYVAEPEGEPATT